MSTIRRDAVASGDTDRRADPAELATRPGASELERVTGPLPVVDLQGGHLHVTTRRDVTIVSIDGGLDDALAAVVLPSLVDVAGGTDAIVVDLDHVTLLDRTALDAVLAVVEGLPDDVARCLVAGRLSTRLVLDRWAVPARVVVFNSVADALQAREFRASGYGPGWQVGAA